MAAFLSTFELAGKPASFAKGAPVRLKDETEWKKLKWNKAKAVEEGDKFTSSFWKNARSVDKDIKKMSAQDVAAESKSGIQTLQSIRREIDRVLADVETPRTAPTEPTKPKVQMKKEKSSILTTKKAAKKASKKTEHKAKTVEVEGTVIQLSMHRHA